MSQTSIDLQSEVNLAVDLLHKLKHNNELNPAKADALISVLESPFFNAVREVYEHVYQTVEVQVNDCLLIRLS